MSSRRDAAARGPRGRRSGPSRDDDRGNSFLDDFLSSVLAVLGIGFLLFAISGVWPPLVAIESPSMEPNIDTGDLVFVMEEHRFASEYQVDETGVATTQGTANTDYEKFNKHGDVIVYKPDGSETATPVIHRAAFWVNESEDWSEKADEGYLSQRATTCERMEYCPAPHDGFITLGDNNPQYDQVQDPRAISEPVKPEWVVGTAEFNLPQIGFLRLRAATLSPAGSADAARLAAG